MFRVGQGPTECNSEVGLLGVGCCGNCVTSTRDFHLVFCHAVCQVKTTAHSFSNISEEPKLSLVHLCMCY